MIDEIQKFMVENSTLYSGINQDYLRKTIAECIEMNQYLYKPDRYTLLYWLVNERDVPLVFEKKQPEEKKNGDVLYIVECCCNDDLGMREAILKLRKLPFKGVFWHRNNKPMIFTRQKGDTI